MKYFAGKNYIIIYLFLSTEGFFNDEGFFGFNDFGFPSKFDYVLKIYITTLLII